MTLSAMACLFKTEFLPLNAAGVGIGRTVSADVFQSAPQESPTCKLLYVTPEQLCNNVCLQDLLTNLHRRHRLARLIVDEVLLNM